MTVAAVVLAAGAASRFGGGKLVARLDGRPILAHVVDAARAAGLDPIVVVVPPSGELDGLELGVVRTVVNPTPQEGLSSSVRLGLRELDDRSDITAAVILPGDQPRVRADVIGQLVDAATASPAPLLIAPLYDEDSGPNPVLARRAAWRLADELVGDRGFGPLLADRPDLVQRVRVSGANPDVDTRVDLLELAWADRVRANREQVDRFREVPDGSDFYAPVTSLFRADPDRTDEPVLDVLRAIARPGDTWLDVGAGAGRYALPLARIVREVIAVDPSEGMLAALNEIAAEHEITNVRTIAARWPMTDPPTGDVGLIAHVGYDIEAIGPFVRALERAARRICVAVLMERQPSSIADVFWPIVHGEERVSLPALPAFVELLRARGHEPEVVMQEREPRAFASRDELAGFLRRQLWIADGGEKERRFEQALHRLIEQRDGGFGLAGQQALPVGVVSWAPMAPG
jgi:molybdenum cofactor cytidylyltransferase